MTHLFAPVKKWALLLWEAIEKFGQDRAYRHGAAIAYFTIFSLPAILMIIIRLVGVVMGEEEIKVRILSDLEAFMGSGTAEEVQRMIEGLQFEAPSFWVAILEIGTLVFGATGTFYSIRDSLNSIWKTQVETKGAGSIFMLLLDRILSFAMVLTLGFILLVSIILETLLVALRNFIAAYYQQVISWIEERLPETGQFIEHLDLIFYLSFSLEILFSFFFTLLIFAMIYRYLPDAIVHWRDVWKGALLSAILFTLGKTLIGWYIGSSTLTSVYGAAGSVVVILVWVYYSAQILLLGAEFVYVTAWKKGRPIQPTKLAQRISDNPIKRIKKTFHSLKYADRGDKGSPKKAKKSQKPDTTEGDQA